MRTIGVIGAGNLGSHLTGLFCRNKANNFITISDQSDIKANHLAAKYGLNSSDNKDNIHESDIIFLAVKPVDMKDVCESIKDVTENNICNKKLIVSTAAGTVSYT